MNTNQQSTNKTPSLVGLSVLITRPAHQQHSLVTAIQSRGGQTHSLPLLSIEALTDKAALQKARGLVQNLDNYHWLIFISSNAARLGGELINDFWPQFPVGVQLAAIGQSTAHTLTSLLEQPVVLPPQGSDSEALLARPEFADVSGQRIAIFRGVGGRELLARTLEARGAEVQYVELYKRMPVEYDQGVVHAEIQHNAVNTLVVHSGESLKGLHELLCTGANDGEAYSEMPIVVPSARVAEQATELGFSQVFNAEGADDESMLAALQNVRASADIDNT